MAGGVCTPSGKVQSLEWGDYAEGTTDRGDLGKYRLRGNFGQNRKSLLTYC
jgi:hypothetical protein